MHHVRQENLPFVGSSHEFVGAEQGDTGVSVFLFHGKPGPGGKPGAGPGPHRHPYDEIQFTREVAGAFCDKVTGTYRRSLYFQPRTKINPRSRDSGVEYSSERGSV